MPGAATKPMTEPAGLVCARCLPAFRPATAARSQAGRLWRVPLLACRHAALTSWPRRPQNRAFSRDGARCGHLDMCAQAEVPSALRTDIHEEASVKTKE